MKSKWIFLCLGLLVLVSACSLSSPPQPVTFTLSPGWGRRAQPEGPVLPFNRVQILGSFHDWLLEDAVSMEPTPDGGWRAELVLEPGVHQYRYITWVEGDDEGALEGDMSKFKHTEEGTGRVLWDLRPVDEVVSDGYQGLIIQFKKQ